MYGISRITVRKALEQLTEEGILVKKHGEGIFVSFTEYVEPVNLSGSFTQSCHMMGVTPGTKILFNGQVEADKKISKALGIDLGEKIIRMERLRSVNQIPIILQWNMHFYAIWIWKTGHYLL